MRQKLIVRIGKRLRKLLNRIIVWHSSVGDPPVFEPERFAWTRELEDNWAPIRAEALAILGKRQAVPPLGELSPDHRRLAGDDRWRSLFLWGYGFRVAANCRRCPRTARLVERIPGLKTAMFSIHAPGTHIPRHRGVTKGLITCHLGLIVPVQKQSCRIAVEERTLFWDEGRCLIFDDTRHHEVWNETEEDRVVLLIQFARPLRFPGNLLNRLVIGAIRWSPFVQDARRNMEAWEKNVGLQGGQRAS